MLSTKNSSSISALAAYEHAITLEYEYKFLVQHKGAVGTWLFIANRYMLLASIAAEILPYGAHVSRFYMLWASNDVTYAPQVQRRTLLDVLSEHHLQYAAYRLDPFLCFTSLITVGVDLYNSSEAAFGHVDDAISLSILLYRLAAVRKVEAMRAIRLTYQVVIITGALTAIASDIIPIVATWLTTYRQVRQAASVGVSAGFGKTLIQQGTLYFVILAAVNLVTLVVFFIPSTSAKLSSPFDVFLPLLPNLVISRFIINLRQLDSQALGSTSHFSRFSMPNFRVASLPRFLGSLGGAVADGDEDVHDEEQDNGTTSPEASLNALQNQETNEGMSGIIPADSDSGEIEVRS
ncbi:hypothetical protein NM688_g3273 [Phlebia brevispora]|uniref:Uncharacterized protein n=1 Tax=Phlebia brevispora TaxID=194682 RepID=A0ACC1T6E6_9APHY|nr:hypothetical protein NM688_g3273 [Phlebia brevispora]